MAVRTAIHLPVNATTQFNRGTTGSPRSAPDPVVLLPGNQQLTVSWTKDLVGQGYRIFYSTSSFSDYTTATRIIIEDPDTDSYIITGLDNGITYYVRVVTVNGAGYSPLTTEVSAIPSLYTNALSCQFDGTTEYCNNTTSSFFDLGKTDPWSISLWCKFPTGSLVGDETLISSLNVGANYEGIEIGLTAGTLLRLYISKHISTDKINIGCPTTMVVETWYHIAVTYDGSNSATGLKVYLDTTPLGKITYSAGPISGVMNSWGNFTVGAREDASKKLKGYLDEVAIYDRELTVDEVVEIYNGGSPNKIDGLASGLDLIAWWRMGDNDIGATIYDRVNTNNLSTVNMDITNYKSDVP